MKYISFSLIIWVVLLFSCDGMYDNLEKYYGEVVYPAKYDTIIGYIGYQRVELDLLKVGRVPSSEIRMGKAKQTVIEYDDEKILIDGLVSWYNVTGLDQTKLYRFHVYTLDEYGNKSVPQEIALIPFSEDDRQTLAVASPRITTSPYSAVVEWPNGLNSVLLEYISMKYEYTDKDGILRTGEIKTGETPRFFISNLASNTNYPIKVTYRVIPIVGDEKILDEVEFESEINIHIPSESDFFIPTEANILNTNGITTFTFEDASVVTKLVYPVYASSLQDIFYFGNLEELDLTGGDIFEVQTLEYNRNEYKREIGGGPFQTYMRNLTTIRDTDALKDLLESKSSKLKKVKYISHSLGIDEILAPYVGTKVELVDLPKEVYFTHNYFLDGLAQDGNWEIRWTYEPDDAPAAPAGTTFDELYKITLWSKNSSFIFSLPIEYRYNAEEYPYLKMSVFAPSKDKFQGEFSPYQRLWFRFLNRLWNYESHSEYGTGEYNLGKDDYRIEDSELGKWKEITVDISKIVEYNTRVIVFNIGGEPSGVDPDIWRNDESKLITYYFANIRLSKEP